jgi:cytochrome c peroxidase
VCSCLRGIGLKTAYFQDGSAITLAQAMSTMAQFQLARTLSNEERQGIVAFVKILTGEYKGKPLF